VEAVLDDLRLWYPVEGEARAADGLVAGEQDGAVGGGVSPDLPAQDGAPQNRASVAASLQSTAMPDRVLAMVGVPFSTVRGADGGPAAGE